MLAWRSEKSYLTLVAPKKPKRFCGAFIKSDPPEARIPSHPSRPTDKIQFNNYILHHSM
jgi:hypothetical protein